MMGQPGRGGPPVSGQDAFGVMDDSINKRRGSTDAIYADIVDGISMGEIVPQDVVMVGQMAMATLQDPKMYPQLADMAMGAGLPPIPPQPSAEVVGALAAVGERIKVEMGQAGGGEEGADKNNNGIPDHLEGPLPRRMKGGREARMVPEGGTLIPDDVRQYHGEKFMQKLFDDARIQKPTAGSGGGGAR